MLATLISRLAMILVCVFLVIDGAAPASAQGVGTQCTSNNQCNAGLRCAEERLTTTTTCRFFIFCETSTLVVKTCRQPCAANAQCGQGQLCQCPQRQPAANCAANKRVCFPA